VTLDTDVIVVAIKELNLDGVAARLFLTHVDDDRLASTDAILKLAINVHLVVASTNTNVPVLEPGLENKLLAHLGLVLGFQNATAGLATIINVGGRTMTKVTRGHDLVDVGLRVLVITLFITGQTELALRHGELELAATTKVVLTLAEPRVERDPIKTVPVNDKVDGESAYRTNKEQVLETETVPPDLQVEGKVGVEQATILFLQTKHLLSAAEKVDLAIGEHLIGVL
jgi:hypothetical protein